MKIQIVKAATKKANMHSRCTYYIDEPPAATK